MSFRKATTIASLVSNSTVELGSFGSVGRSAAELRFRDFVTVIGLMPWRLASLLKLT